MARKNPWTGIQIKTLKRMWEENHSLGEIAAVVNHPSGCVAHMRRRLGLPACSKAGLIIRQKAAWEKKPVEEKKRIIWARAFARKCLWKQRQQIMQSKEAVSEENRGV